MKRYLLAIVNAITELTEVFRFGMEDVMERFEDIDTSLYIMATTKNEDDFVEELAQEYQWGFDDGYELARSVFEEVTVKPPSLEELNTELREAYWEDEEEDFIYDAEFLYDQMFST